MNISWNARVDSAHAVVGTLLAVLGISSWCFYLPAWVPTAVVSVSDVYIVAVLICLATKGVPVLPTKLAALWQLLMLVVSIVPAFAALYLASGGVRHSTTGVPPDWLDAVYFSIVTLATVGYGDFTPTNTAAKITACCEIGSGILLLLLAVPVVASRLSTWDAAD